MHLNIEIKAKCHNPRQIQEILILQGGKYIGLDHQVDTYFKVKNGRLKLREGTIENCLIFYDRQNKKGPKDSNIILYKHEQQPDLKQILLASHDVLTVVDKKRHIYFIDNVKFHVDYVKDLGSFCEIEAIDTTGNLTRDTLLDQCKKYMKVLKISDGDLISCSYSDLLLEKRSDTCS